MSACFKYIVLCLPVFLIQILYAQEFVYVNTDNLILRDRPEQKYMVFAILHAGCKLTIDHTDIGYNKNKAVNARFYHVSHTYVDSRGISHYQRRMDRKKICSLGPGVCCRAGHRNNSLAEIHLIPYIGTTEDDPNEWNYTRFPYPKYKGGEKHFIIASRYKKVYHTGARGGCYYISATGRKVYVDSKYCKNVK
jgi:hypothetical protein